MTPSDQQAARAVLRQGRATYQRLDQLRGPEDAAADIIDLWAAAESAMRVMLGGSLLSGQPLVRELRQREVITLEQANALATFWDTRARMDDVGYKPTLTDVGYARVGYNELSKAVEQAAADATSPSLAPSPAHPTQPITLTSSSAQESENEVDTDYDSVGHRLSTPMIAGIGVSVLVIVTIVVYLMSRGVSYDHQIASGIDLMRSGQIEAARAQFAQAAQDHPDQSDPHVFLSRLSREEADMSTARQELDTAIRLNPSSAIAQREMGILLLAQKNAELARRFLVRAVQLAPTDLSAQGYLGCALMQMNRIEEAQKFLTRAGPGSWSSCATPPRALGLGAGAPLSA